MGWKKRVLALLLAGAITVSSMPTMAFAEGTEEALSETEPAASETAAEIITEGTDTPQTTAAQVLDSGTCGDNATWTLNDAGVLTISGTGAMTDYSGEAYVPWNAYKSQITSVIIEEGITHMGRVAFCGLTSLTSVMLPQTLTNIGEFGFQNCTALSSLTIPGSVEIIGANAFYGCKALKEIVIPEGVTTINPKAFMESGLQVVTIPKSLTYVGSNAFWSGSIKQVNISDLSSWCRISFDGSASNPLYSAKKLYLNGELITDLVIPEGVTKISDYAFRCATCLTSVSIPEGVTEIGNEAFSDCSNVKKVVIPGTVTKFGERAFAYCSALTQVEVSDLAAWCGIDFTSEDSNPLTFAKNLYQNGKLVKDLVIPDGVTQISTKAFRGANCLTSVTIPDSVTSIGSYAFSNCSNLSSVTFQSDAPTISSDAFTGVTATAYYPGGNSTWDSVINQNYGGTITWEPYYNNLGNGTFGEDLAWTVSNEGVLTISGTGAMPDYTEAEGAPWQAYADQITSVVVEEGVTSIGNYAFYRIAGITAATLPRNISVIGNYAFWGCTGMASITMPETAEAIGSNAFNSCRSLTEVVIPEGVTSIGSCAFLSCTSLASVVIPAGVTSIGGSAFHSCSSLTSVVIPESVTSIGGSAFSGCSSLKEVVIPAGITSIGDSVFANCTGLTSVVIPAGVTSIGSYAFSGCTNLAEVVIPAGVTSIGSYAFYKCSSLTSVVIPAGVASIEAYTFSECGSLTSVVISEGVAGIGDYAFSQCSNLAEVVIQKGVTSIGSWAFYSCKSLKEIVIPEGVTTIGKCAFYWCTGLTSVTISKGAGSIGNMAFSHCDSLKSVVILEGVTSIGEQAFYSCSNLAELVFPESLKTIKKEAFSSCSSLTSIVIPKGVTSIGSYAFYACESMTEIIFQCNAPSINSTAFTFVTATAYYPGGDSTWDKHISPNLFCGGTFTWKPYYETLGSGTCGENLTWTFESSGILTISGTGAMPDYTYSAPAPWQEFANLITTVVVEEGVTNIGSYAFYNITGIATVSLPQSIKTIGSYAFYGCSGMTSVTIPEGVTSIGNYAFYKCIGLTSVIIPEGVISIGNYAFEYCTSLKSVAIPSTLTSIGIYAFRDCSALERVDITNLESWCKLYFTGTGTANPLYYGHNLYLNGTLVTDLTIPESITKIDSQAFRGASCLTSVTIPDSVTSIGVSAFLDCSNLAEVVIPESVTRIEDFAFKNCSSLKEIVIPEGVTIIGDSTFYNCSSLTSIVIPEGVTSIGSEAFRVCSSLTSVVIPEGVTSLGSYAFSGCSSLTEVVIPESVTSMGRDAFSGCKSLTSVVIPESVTGIVDWAFSGCSSLASVVIPKGVTYIAYEAFYRCSSLTEVVLPESVTKIGTRAFSACTSLTEITFQSNAPTISSDAFTGVTAIGYYPYSDSTWNEIVSQNKGFGGTITWKPLISLGHLSGLTTSRILSSSLEISWDAVETEELAGYVVCRDGVELATVEENRFLDRNLTTGTAYTYQVYAKLTDGSMSKAAELTATPAGPDISLLQPGTLLDGENAVIQARVPNRGNLEPVDGVSPVVQVYYEADGTYVLLGEARQVELTEQAGTYAYTWNNQQIPEGTYNIKAVITDADGGTALDVQAYHIDRTPPKQLVGVTAIGAADGVHLSWPISWEVDTTRYTVYRKLRTEDTFTAVKTISGRDQLAWTDTTVDEVSLYDYYVVGVDSYGREGDASEIVSATRAEDTEAPQITGMTPTSGKTLKDTVTFQVTAIDNVSPISVKLEWSQDKAAWNVFQEPENGRFSGSLDTTALTDGNLYIRATAYDAAGNASAAWQNVYRADNNGPEQVQDLSYTSTSVTVTLFWKNVADADIAYFQVERFVGENNYVFVAKVEDTLGYHITDLVPDRSYVYRVVGYDQAGNRGIPSENLETRTEKDSLAPVITRLRPVPGYYSQSIPVTAQATDESGIVSITIQTSRDNLNWTDVTTSTYTGNAKTETLAYTLDISALEEGFFYFRAIAKDMAGNVSISDSTAPYVQYIVDHTPPAAPENLTVSGESGRMELTWTQGPETDLRYYSVYRSETADGIYEMLVFNLEKLSYVDRTAAEEVTYFYKLAVDDQAGNLSAFSQTVSGKVAKDETKPVIHSVSPVAGAALSPNYRTIQVLASDDRALDAIVINYSLDGENYILLSESTELDPAGDSFAATVPADSFGDGATVYTQIFARDNAGNLSEVVENTYIMDKAAPQILELQAAYSEAEQGIVLTWKDGAEADLAGFRIYQKTEADEDYTLIAQRAPAESGSYTVTDRNLPKTQAVYYYKVESVDKVNNTDVDILNITVEPVKDVTAPVAVLSCETLMRTGAEYILDATKSQDDVGITAYEFWLGDTMLSNKQRFIHSFSTAGEYTITLKVYDAEGNMGQTLKTITVQDHVEIATVNIQVVDQYGNPVPNAPVYFNLGQEDQVVLDTDLNGVSSFTTVAGKHTVGCFIPGNEWLPVQRELIVAANMETTARLVMVKQQLIEGQFEVERMTFEEMVSAGIDVTNPENQNVIKVNVTAQYTSEITDTTLVYNPNTGKFMNDSELDYIEIKDENGTGIGRVWIPIPIQNPDMTGSGGSGSNSGSGDINDLLPAIAFLDIPMEAQYLKEFFDVKLHIVNNASAEFAMLNNEVTLNVPEGMTLMTNSGSAATVEIPSIQGQTQQSVGWILRGDTAGEYALSAEFTGTLSQFNSRINVLFQSSEPIQVYGLEAVQLEAVLNSTLQNDAFYFNLSIENTSSIDINMPSIGVVDDILSTYIQKGTGQWTPQITLLNTVLSNAAGYSQEIGADSTVTRLAAGEKLTRKYAVYDVVDDDTFNNQVWYFREAFEQVAQSYGVNFKISLMEMEQYSTENALEKIERIHSTQSSRDAFDFLIQDSNFFYVKEANGRDGVEYLTGEVLYGAVQPIFNFDVTANQEELQKIIRQLVIRLLEDETMQDSVGSNIHSFYLDAMRTLLNVVNDTLAASKLENKDAMIAKVSELLDNASTVRSWANYLEKEGPQGIWKRLCSTLTSVGGVQESLDAVLWSNYTEAFKSLISEKCVILNNVTDVLDQTVDAWHESAELTVQLVTLAAANEETALLLNMFRNNFSQQGISGDAKYDAVLAEVTSMHNVIEETLSAQISRFCTGMTGEATEAIRAEAALEKLNQAFGVNAGVIYTLLRVAFSGMNDVFQWGQGTDFLHTLQIGTLMSRAMGFAALRNGSVATTETDAVYQLKAIKYLIKLRLLFETYYTECNANNTETLDYVNSAYTEDFANLPDYANYITRILQSYRDEIFSMYVSDPNIPDAPTVTLDYLNSATVESFSDAYEYSFNGSTWVTCSGGQIPVIPGTVAQKLQVRARATQNNAVGATGYLTIPAMPVLLCDVEVLWQGSSYQITGLTDGWYEYQFTNEASGFVKSGSFRVINGTATLYSTMEYVYLAVCSQATETSFSSRVRYLTVKDPQDDWIIVEDTLRAYGNPGSDAMTAIEYFQKEFGAQVVEISDLDGNQILGTELMGTGYRLIADGVTYIVVIRGDVNGDTDVSVLDVYGMLYHMEGTKPLEDAYLAAGCISGGEDIDLFDIFAVFTYLETGSFNE